MQTSRDSTAMNTKVSMETPDQALTMEWIMVATTLTEKDPQLR